jgi:hypothetical protein
MFSPLFTGASALGSQAHSLVGNNSKFFMKGKVKDPQEGPHRLSPLFTLGLLLHLVRPQGLEPVKPLLGCPNLKRTPNNWTLGKNCT